MERSIFKFGICLGELIVMSEGKRLLRNDAIDAFRLVCAILVIIIHTNPFYDINKFFGFLICQVVVRIAVPFFFVVSGYFLLLGLKRRGGQYAIRYIKKLLYEYAIWSLIYFLIDYSQLKDEINLVSFLKNCIVTFTIFGSHYHLWFYPALLFSIVIITIFWKIKKLRYLYLCTLVLYLFGSLALAYSRIIIKIPFVDKIINFTYFENIRRIILMALPFCMLGAALSKYKDIGKNEGLHLLVTGILYLIEVILVTIFKLGDSIVLTIMLYPFVANFVLFLLSCKKQISGGNLGRRLSATIYFVHPIFIMVWNTVLENIHIDKKRTCIWILTTVSSVIFSYFLYKLKGGVKCMIENEE